MKAIAIFTADDSNPGSIMIQEATGGKWSHVAIGFEKDDPRNPIVYFESSCDHDSGSSEDGLRGPLPFKELIRWQCKDEQHRRLQMVDIYLDAERAMTSFKFLLSMVGHIHYAHLQVILNMSALLFPLQIVRRYASREHWTCSEAFARAMPYDIQIEALKVGEVTYDYIMPSGSRLPSVFDGVRAWNQAHGLPG